MACPSFPATFEISVEVFPWDVHDHKANKWPRLLNILIWSHTEWRPKRACGANQDLGWKDRFDSNRIAPDSVAH